MAVSKVLITSARLGIFAELARGPQRAGSLAKTLGLHGPALELVLDGLASMGHLQRRAGAYRLSPRATKWLNPRSPTYIGGFIAALDDAWPWWAELPKVLRTGQTFEIHSRQSNDPYWDRYIQGQFELARLSAQEVAKALKLPTQPSKLLDVAGAHGWFSAVLCTRYPGLHATVVDLPGSAAVGRRIMAETGMEKLVGYIEGNALEVELGGPYDVALCFNLVHHLSADQVLTLFKRIRGSLRPGATFAILDPLKSPPDAKPRGAVLSLLFFLTSSGGLHSSSDLAAWLRQAGFGNPKSVPIRSIPGQNLYQATAI